MKFILAVGTVCLGLACLSTVYSIKCHVCTSGTEAPCASSNVTVLEQYKVDCAVASGTAAIGGKELTRCAKIVKDGEITRSCFYVDAGMNDNACKTGNGATACLCSTDYCNAGNGLYSGAQTWFRLMILGLVCYGLTWY